MIMKRNFYFYLNIGRLFLVTSLTYDFPLYNKQLRDAGIPTLSIDIDQQPTNYDQARTRLQAFAEIL